MEIDDSYKQSMVSVNNLETVSNETLEILLDSCCKSLSKQQDSEIPNFLGSNLVLIKQLHATLLHVFAQGVRHNLSTEDFYNFLVTECTVVKPRAELLGSYYAKWFQPIRVQLLNIGTYLPHITDVKWKVEHVVKTNSLDIPAGPFFHIALKTEKYDNNLKGPKVETVKFTCTHQELQDLVYKLKDAANHCQKVAGGLLSQ